MIAIGIIIKKLMQFIITKHGLALHALSFMPQYVAAQLPLSMVV